MNKHRDPKGGTGKPAQTQRIGQHAAGVCQGAKDTNKKPGS